MFEKIERLAPQWFLAAFVVVVAVFIYIYRNPPVPYCDSEFASFKKAQSKFMLSRKYKEFKEMCLEANTAGACGPYFRGHEAFVKDLLLVKEDCQAVISSNAGLRKRMQNFLIETARLAWDKSGPIGVSGRFSWLTRRQLQIFCKVKGAYSLYYGEARYRALQEHIIKVLRKEGETPIKKECEPDVPEEDCKQEVLRIENKNKNLRKEEILERSILSTPCQRLN